MFLARAPVVGIKRITPKIINIDRVMILPVLANICCPPGSFFWCFDVTLTRNFSWGALQLLFLTGVEMNLLMAEETNSSLS